MRTPPTLPALQSEDETLPRVRVTVPVTQETLEAFQRLAKASGMSTGRAMGDWLMDTLDAVQFMADTVEKARAAPRIVAQELHAYALGLGDETGELLERVRALSRKGPAGGALPEARPAAGPGPTPPSNTGVTTTKTQTRKGGIGGKNSR